MFIEGMAAGSDRHGGNGPLWGRLASDYWREVRNKIESWDFKLADLA